MTEEEQKAIKYFNNLKTTIDESFMLLDEGIKVNCGKEMIKQITTVLNLIQKQQKELEERYKLQKAINSQLICYKEASFRKDTELEKKDKIINEMAKYIKEPYYVITFGSRKPKIEIIKEYFKKEVEDK